MGTQRSGQVPRSGPKIKDGKSSAKNGMQRFSDSRQLACFSMGTSQPAFGHLLPEFFDPLIFFFFQKSPW